MTKRLVQRTATPGRRGALATATREPNEERTRP
ncbi:hypothetical protein DFJ64_2555 [Thermasporomyces composti]|uniref:Uncharacterized protein n=1 Tax=Thermasporomyces composti TaxID=696763 RepID=A0A3D9V6K9_THECX|nr:hypothetical protein DFJ64_2555 [Thermasporomyces composti]